MSGYFVTLGDDRDTLAEAERVLGALPANIDRARARANRALKTWTERQVLRAAASAVETTQKALKAMMRVNAHNRDGGFVIWIGTNPIKAHRLGVVRWTRRMEGARAGQRLFPGSWSWSTGDTQGLVMERIGRFGRNGNPRLERIDSARAEVHTDILDAVEALMPQIGARYQETLLKELDRELARERRLG